MMLSSPDKPTVLVVDDTADNLTLMAALLKDAYRVKVANHGEKALAIVASGSIPDLILLDIMMPEIDGYEVCRRLKANPATRDIPVIFLTAKSDEAAEAQGFSLHAVDYITKPISPPILLARVRNHIALSVHTQMLQSLSVKLSRYLSPQVYKSIFEGTQDVSIQAVRKKLTIFFSDIKDFTKTSEHMQPEDMTYLLNSYFSEMSKIALEFGATIDKFIGDAIVIFFGDPQSLGVQDDALQCVRMAVAMQRRMAHLRSVWHDKGYRQPFHVRVGINTGYCHVGNFGSEERMDYTVIGSEVNLAARLEQNGEPDGVILSYETHALVKHEFDAEECAPLLAKGVSREIRCFALRNLHTADAPAAGVDLRYPGLRLTLEPEKLSPEARLQAIEDLQSALQVIRSQA
ncbi:adenylate/guanylate cyclase domain-containing protein [Variovorax sp. HJSM1_2]|uniref:adenylate/guanylate cyclase domain-containing protein n=1 Tax=Variovorax sp. HJSM1_2 TaxID=3366263 RepID=UPI003BE93171